jgi:hypothetical protein
MQGKNKERNENTERTQNKDLFPAHADGINTETDTKKEYKLVPRARGRSDFCGDFSTKKSTCSTFRGMPRPQSRF